MESIHPLSYGQKIFWEVNLEFGPNNKRVMHLALYRYARDRNIFDLEHCKS